MKKKIIWYILVPLVIISLVATFFIIKNLNSLKLSISGISINEEEYKAFINMKKYYVTEYFINKYGADIDADFWESDFEGEYPYKVLADETINELLRVHSIYKIATEKGYIDSEEYSDFIKRLNNENALRKQNIEEGRPVYGLSEFTEELYLEYETDQIQKAYCDDLSNEGMEIPIEESTKYYDENKDSMFIKNDDFELTYIKVYYGILDLTEEEINEIKNRMTEISKKVDENNSLLSLVEKDDILKEYFKHEKVLSNEVSTRSKDIGDILAIATILDKGELSPVLDENNCLFLVECTNKIDYDYIPIEEVMDNINKILREQKYDEIIKNRSNDLVVEGDINNIYKFTKHILK